MKSDVIPIHTDESCPGRAPLPVREPRLVGDAARLARIIASLQEQMGKELGQQEPIGAWLRELHLGEGEADMRLASELGCRGQSYASVAFDTLRVLLPDTDIYVRTEGH